MSRIHIECEINGDDAESFIISGKSNLNFRNEPDWEKPNDVNEDNQYEIKNFHDWLKRKI